jgi:hypothetical protein
MFSFTKFGVKGYFKRFFAPSSFFWICLREDQTTLFGVTEQYLYTASIVTKEVKMSIFGHLDSEIIVCVLIVLIFLLASFFCILWKVNYRAHPNEQTIRVVGF